MRQTEERGSWASFVCVSLSARGTVVCPGTPALLCPIFVISPSGRRIALAVLFSRGSLLPSVDETKTTHRLLSVRPSAPSVFTSPPKQTLLLSVQRPLCPFVPSLSFSLTPLGKNISTQYLCPSFSAHPFLLFFTNFPFHFPLSFACVEAHPVFSFNSSTFFFHCRFNTFVLCIFGDSFPSFVDISSSSPRAHGALFSDCKYLFHQQEIARRNSKLITSSPIRCQPSPHFFRLFFVFPLCPHSLFSPPKNSLEPAAQKPKRARPPTAARKITCSTHSSCSKPTARSPQPAARSPQHVLHWSRRRPAALSSCPV